MKHEAVDELFERTRTQGDIRHPAVPPVEGGGIDLQVKAIREKLKLSQPKFADMLGISLGTLRCWEQGRRYPEGPARVLLRVAAARPDVVFSVTHGEPARDEHPPQPSPARRRAPASAAR
jgi:putative transcriptional regulator